LSTFRLIEQIFANLPRGDGAARPLTLLGVPGSNPRWLVAEDGRALGATLANWSPYRYWSRVAWQLIRKANRYGVVGALPRVHRFRAPGFVDWCALGWRESEPPHIAVYVGTPGPTRKAIIHLVERSSGKCAAVVKVPIAAASKNAILREAGTLTTLAEERFDASPRLLHIDRERGVSVQQYVAGRSASRKLKPEYLEVLRSLLLPGELTTLGGHANAWEAAIGQVDDGSRRDLLQRALEQMEDDRALPACWAHGDFAPWNIRERHELPPMLIDWEDAERGGLPLHDAYHFLHMQDFLFGSKPQLHSAELAAFGAELNLNSEQCRKLELAHLVDAHLQSSTRNQARSEFLLKTLAGAVHEGHAARRPLVSGVSAEEKHQQGKAAARNREELFDSVIAALNTENIPYCILSGFELDGASDVDIMVAPEHRRYIPQLLFDAARRAGGLLVQAIEHETTATYFVLAGLRDGELSYLDIDCYTDYRRNGRTWLRADEVITARQKRANFYVPSTKDEFTYYLVKKVLKRSISLRQLAKLSDLFAQRRRECRASMARFFPQQAHALESAILRQDLSWFEQQMPVLNRDLFGSRSLERPPQFCAAKLGEAARWVRRVAQPTGMWIESAGGLRTAEDLAASLSPAFRRTAVLPAGTNPLKRLASVVLGRVRSTLVISVNGNLSQSRAARRFLRSVAPEMKLAPKEAGQEEAWGAILRFLAGRMEGRMHLRKVSPGDCEPSSGLGSERVELSAAGSR
jgi:phosphotransferase family enzyme